MSRTCHQKPSFGLKKKPQQLGLATVEFAVVGLVFFIVLFSLFEVGRVMFTLNQLTNLSRATARLAAVCPVSEHDIIKQAAKEVSVLSHISNDVLHITYLDSDMNELDATLDSDFYDIRFVQAEIVNFEHRILIPVYQKTFRFNGFKTIINSESLGVLPIAEPDATFTCG